MEVSGELFEAGYEYGTIGTHRTAISLYHELVEEMKIRVHPKVSKLMQGVSNARPPQPKHTSIWDVQRFLNFIKENCGDSKEITMFIALATGSRAIEINHFNIENIGQLKNQCVLKFSKLHKGLKKAKSPLP